MTPGVEEVQEAKPPSTEGLKKTALDQLGADVPAGVTPAEKSRSWSTHQTHLNEHGNEEEKAAFQEKGLQTAAWLMKTNTPRYFSVEKEVRASAEPTGIGQGQRHQGYLLDRGPRTQ